MGTWGGATSRGMKRRQGEETRMGNGDGIRDAFDIQYSISLFFIELFDDNKYFSIRYIGLRILFTFGR
jgi:hypothetical protein